MQDRLQRKEEMRLLKQAQEKVKEQEMDESGFVTIDEQENDGSGEEIQDFEEKIIEENK